MSLRHLQNLNFVDDFVPGQTFLFQKKFTRQVFRLHNCLEDIFRETEKAVLRNSKSAF